jgi:hypothetical protein
MAFVLALSELPEPPPTVTPSAAAWLPTRTTTAQLPLPCGVTVYVAGSEVDAVANVATGEQPMGSITGAGSPATLLLTVKVCAAEPAPPKLSDDGETVIVAAVGGTGVNDPPPPPPPPPPQAARAHAARAPTSERIRTAIKSSFRASR